MKTYQDMNNEEIKEQLEWSDQHEFSYGYSMWAFKEIERLNYIINELEKWLKEHSKIDYNCREIIIHEQLALNTAYEYLQELKENK